MTELIWDGKYDEHGKKIAPLRLALPFQTVETVNESAQERHRTLDLFAEGKTAEWRNRLIWGDKKYVLPSLLPEFAGKVNLVYIDPPFDTGADFSFTTTIPDAPHDLTEVNTNSAVGGGSGITFVKEPNVIEQKAYRDTWGKGLDSYLKWFYETVVLLRELLTDNGSLYVHLDWHVGHYAKAVLDEVFGIENFQREIVWDISVLSGYKTLANNWIRGHDILFFYTKSETFTFNKQSTEHRSEYIARFNKVDEQGRRYFDGRGNRRYLDDAVEKGKAIGDVWNDIMSFQQMPTAAERVDYATQKPESLLERIIKTNSNEGDLVLDCFCGSGTTAAVAEKLNRRWITCDLGRFAIHTARKRLLAIDKVRPFMVQNLGKYERQQWQTAEFGERAEAVQHNYRQFILRLYRAQPLTGYVWMHGVRAGRFVHVGDVAAPISTSDVASIAAEFRRAIGSGANAPTQSSVDILGWDFAFELNEVAKQQAALAGIEVRFVRIPREVLEKKAVEQGDIKFFELAALGVKHEITNRAVSLELTDFVIPLDDVPDDVQRAITHWEQWIDYWAVDWDNKGDTFHNQWQSYRTRKERNLQKRIVSPPGTYPEAGIYKVVIKVIDILGNDTTKTLSIEVT